MPAKEELTKSFWQEWPIPAFTKLNHNLETDVCILGAGIAGLSCAYQLLRNGYRVVVMDSGPIGGRQTLRTTAHLCNALDDRYFEIERLHGLEHAKAVAESHADAIDQIEKVCGEENISCDFQRLNGYLFLGPADDEELLIKECKAARDAGVKVMSLPSVPNLAFNSGPCLRFSNQAQFHPGKYIGGLVQAIARMGGFIFAHTHADLIIGGPNARVTTTSGHIVHTDSIIVATNSPVNNTLAIHTKQAAYRSYVLGFEVPKQSIPAVLLWDTSDPYHYVRLHQDPSSAYDLLIVGGEDHRTGQATNAEERFQNLQAWTRFRFKGIREPLYRWSGQIIEPVDKLAYIGRNPVDYDNVFIATGDSGNGMTYGVIAGMLLTDLILKRPNDWEKVYAPNRVNVRSAGEFARENINTAVQYDAWITGGDVSSLDDIREGSGAVIRQGVGKVAAYRDTDGRLTVCSAVCPHLGGIVAWNAGEKTWDCPCHGSRFDRFGKVINGPANANLASIDEETLETPVNEIPVTEGTWAYPPVPLL